MAIDSTGSTVPGVIVSSDSERHLHNHPWNRGLSIVLSGNYIEEVVSDICPLANASGCVTYKRLIRWFNRIDGNRFHRIHDAKPGTWTLFVHGARSVLPSGKLKGWGFLESRYADVGTIKLETVFTSFDDSPGPEWWIIVPKGIDAGRLPLTGLPVAKCAPRTDGKPPWKFPL